MREILGMIFRRRRYAVMIACEGIILRSEAGDKPGGFMTTRYVDAKSQEDALEAAFQMLQRRDKATLGAIKEWSGHPLKLEVEEIREVSWFMRRFRPGAGFTFWTDSEDGGKE
jgi:hypothetical protein